MGKYTKEQFESLRMENKMLKEQNTEVFGFLLSLFGDCMPIALEIKEARGFLKVFKIFKLAIHLAHTLIQYFDKKPTQKIWY